jgi:hypothetical protein
VNSAGGNELIGHPNLEFHPRDVWGCHRRPCRSGSRRFASVVIWPGGACRVTQLLVGAGPSVS